MMNDDYDGFGVRILEEDGVLMAQFIEYPEVAACGATVTAALLQLKAVWDKTKDLYLNRHAPVSESRH
jgi:predicted RNase H-like HicB family nuclease